MNKRHLHHIWRYLRAVRPWYFLVLLLVSGAICLITLRTNNQEMARLRSAVYTADKSGNNVEESLRELRSYVYAHMNTSLSTGPNAVHPPIQLKYTYERLQAAQQQQLQQTNASLYNDAQSFCEQQDSADFSGRNRVPCIESYVTSHGATLTPIPDALYKFDFTSAKWSPDIAGLSMVAAAIFGILFTATAGYSWWAKKYL